MFTTREKRIARRLLLRTLPLVGEGWYICDALCEVAENQRESDIAWELRQLIDERLEGHLSYPGWLLKTHPEFCEKMDLTSCLDYDPAWIGWNGQFIQGRLTWVGALIAEVS